MNHPAGLESFVLARMPEILLAVTVPASICGLLCPGAQILALAIIVAWWFMLVPVALVSLTVVVMKGPACRADSYGQARTRKERLPASTRRRK